MTVFCSGENTKMLSFAPNATIQDLRKVKFANVPSITCPLDHDWCGILAPRTSHVFFSLMGGEYPIRK